jgi:DNA-binding NarL/FixJ family response regulator
VTTLADPRSAFPPGDVRVMVADDDQALREALTDLLGDMGFEMVGAAVDGSHAVAMAEDLVPDVILMDIRMPGLDGIEATRLITSRFPQVKVVIFSAYDDPALSTSAADLGAFCYLVKGCPPKLIRDVVLQAGVSARP